MNTALFERYFAPATPSPLLAAIGHSQQRHSRPGLQTHQHPYYEICLLIRGEVDWFIEDQNITLASNQALITAPGQAHGCHLNVIQPCELRWLQVDHRCGLHPRLQQGLADHAGTLIDGGNDLIADHQALLEECRNARLDSQQVVELTLPLLLHRLIRHLDHKKDEEQPWPRSLQEALKAIDNAPDHPWSVAELATIARVGRSRLQQLFSVHLVLVQRKLENIQAGEVNKMAC
jgi:hypothetical protein